MLQAHRRPDGSIRVHTDGQPLQPKHFQQAEDRAQALAEIREEEVLFFGIDLPVLELYENAYRDFAEVGRYKLARKPLLSVAREPRHFYVVICAEKRAGRVRRHAYQTRGKVTQAEAFAAGSRRHPNAKVTVIARKSRAA